MTRRTRFSAGWLTCALAATLGLGASGAGCGSGPGSKSSGDATSGSTGGATASSTGSVTTGSTGGATASSTASATGGSAASSTGSATASSTGSATTGSTGGSAASSTGSATAGSTGGAATASSTGSVTSGSTGGSTAGAPGWVLWGEDQGGSTCATLTGRLRCWGLNHYGQLGLGDTLNRGDMPGEMGDALPVVALGTGRSAVSVAIGYDHACAVLDDGELKCWGDNSFGELGLGDTMARGDMAGEMGDSLPAVDLGTGRTAVAVAVAQSSTCAVLDDGEVKCWGDNHFGQLGLGDTSDRGGAPGDMGDDLPAVDLGTGRTALAVSIADGFSCALLDDHQVKCWGDNLHGVLGTGDLLSYGVTPGQMGDNLPEVSLGTGRTVLAVAAGAAHVCALLDDHQVKCWGDNPDGELGQGDTVTRGDSGGTLGDNLPAVDLGTGRTVAAIAVGSYHTCAVLDDAELKCWGSGFLFGELGLGDTKNRGDQPGEMGDALPAVDLGTGRTVTRVVAGSYFSCATLDDREIKCWGTGSFGELGLGDTENRGDQPGEMGDALPATDLGN